MYSKFKVVAGPKDTDFGIARLIELPDGSGRGEVFNLTTKTWGPATNPKLTLGEVFDSKPVSDAFAARIGMPIEEFDTWLKY